jgi:hypothetical protein
MVVETKMGTRPLQTISSYIDSSAPFKLSLNFVCAKNSYPNAPTELYLYHVTNERCLEPVSLGFVTLYHRVVTYPSRTFDGPDQMMTKQ